MGETPDQARKTVVATRGRLDHTLDQLEARLRHELNPSVRIHRDGPRVALAAAVVAVAGTVYLIRSRRLHRVEQEERVDWIAAMPEEWRERLQELLAEAVGERQLRAPRAELKSHRPAWQSLALRGARIALPVAMNAAAQRLSKRAEERGAPGFQTTPL